MKETGIQPRSMAQQDPSPCSFMLNGLTELKVGSKFTAGEGGESVIGSETSMERPQKN